MPEYVVTDTDRPHSQEAWAEERDGQGRVLRPARPARNEVQVQVRMDRQYRAQVRLPRGQINTVPRRRKAIADACARFALGEEIAPGVQVVEVETRFTPAQEALVAPEERDEGGNLVREETFAPATPEREEYSVTLRLQGLHLTKVGLSPEELARPDWKATLASRAAAAESFER